MCVGIAFEEDAMMEIKRAKKIDMFDYDPQKEEDQDESGELAKKIPIKSVQCGGMHTVALTPTGEAYSWGCNDEGALGRQGKDNQPE